MKGIEEQKIKDNLQTILNFIASDQFEFNKVKISSTFISIVFVSDFEPVYKYSSISKYQARGMIKINDKKYLLIIDYFYSIGDFMIYAVIQKTKVKLAEYNINDIPDL